MTEQEEFLWYITSMGAMDKFGDEIPPEVIDRIRLEMDVIVPNRFTDYILIIWDIHDFCRNPDRVIPFCKMMGLKPPPDGIVPLGPGRGSVGGSMVCYCIGIHECDPLLYGLFFERFLNPERIAYPDIDFDISQKYRYIVLAYIAHKYGANRVAQIITYTTLSAKTCTSDVLKSANVPDSMINAVKATIPDEPGITFGELEKNDKFMKVLQSVVFPDTMMVVDKSNAHKIIADKVCCGDATADRTNLDAVNSILNGTIQRVEITVKSSWTWEKALQIMKDLEGLNKYESTHAAGVVVAPVELDTSVPLLKKDGDGVLACQYDARSLEDIGFLKMDALGLRTVDVNHESGRLVRQWVDPEFDIKRIKKNNEKAIQLIRSGDTVGIFQIESSGFTSMMQDIDIGGYESPRDIIKTHIPYLEREQMEVLEFLWISAGIAMYRPGPLDAILEGKTMVKHIIDRKAGKEPTVYLFPEEKGYLAETYGILVYQEQVMARVRQMTGCTMGRADVLRKAMGKKDPVLMKEQMDWFEQSALSHDFSTAIQDVNHKAQLVSRAKEEIETFARYGFNKAHTCEYAIICYENAFFKANYPVQFYTALLNSETGNPERQTAIIRDMLKHGINLLPPLINESEADFTMTDKDTIRFGLAAIKGLGDKAMECIMEERRTGGAFKSIEEFRVRVPATLCNVTAMTNLAKCGAFDVLMGKCLVPIDKRSTLVASMKGICDGVGKLTKKKGKDKPAPTKEEALAKLPYTSYQITRAEEDLIEYAIWEKEILKYYISAHPIDAYIDEMKRWTAIGDVEPENLPNEFYVCGFIDSFHETVIKKEGRNKGKSMAFVTVGNEHRAYEATLFPGIYESCVPYLKTGNPVAMKCRRGFYQGKVSIEGVYMRHLQNSGIRDCPECHLWLNDTDMMALIGLKGMFDEHPGTTIAYIHVRQGYHNITIRCGKSIALNDRIINYVNTIGEVSYKPF